MRLLILALALSTAPSASAGPATKASPFVESKAPPKALARPDRSVRGVINPNGPLSSTCPPTSRYEAARRGGKLPPTLLTELPAADMYNAVYRKIGGCEVPIIVRYDVGGTASGRR